METAEKHPTKVASRHSSDYDNADTCQRIGTNTHLLGNDIYRGVKTQHPDATEVQITVLKVDSWQTHFSVTPPSNFLSETIYTVKQ